MRTFRINVNGKDYTVSVDDPSASPATVDVNGHKFQVTIDETTRAARPTSAIDVQPEIEETFAPVVTPTFVSAAPEPKTAEAPTAAPAAGKGSEQIVAPMPGKILDILVKVGGRVKHGETLCNLEAMKMKSPIRSTANGTIAQILVTEGQNVNYGEVLFTLA